MTGSTPPTSAQPELNNHLAAAIRQADAAAIKHAIRCGANVNAQVVNDLIDGDTCSLLYLAISEGSADAVNILLEAGASINDGILSVAAWGGNADIIKALLEAGASVDFQRSDSQRTALHYAACGENLKSIKLLLAAGADPSIKCTYLNNETPIGAAHREGHKDIADCMQAVQDDPSNRPTPESVGLDMKKRIAALEASGKPLGPFTQTEKKRIAQRETREAQRQAVLRGEGI